jgi:hypothetical protein
VVAEAGRLVLETPDGGLFVVSTALDAVDDEGSADYLRKNVEFAVAEGMLREPDHENGPFWIDGNYDDVQDVHDLYGYELSLAIDPLSGEAVPAEYVRPVWQYGYYDPDAQPDLGFIFQAIGKSLYLGGELDATVLKAVEPVFRLADSLVYSFEPGGGYPED